MRRAERLFRLVNEMRSRGLSRADDLAAHFEISVRTVYRDIAHLQASGLPIEGEAGVGYLLRPGFDLPSMTFTHDQVEALAVGLSFAESLDDPALAAAAREARFKIQASMPQPEARKLTDAPYFSMRRSTGAPPIAAMLRKAIRKRHCVEVTYADANGRQSYRLVRPLAIWNLSDGWMFSGWCDLRNGFRTFRFDRISSFAVTQIIFDEDDAKSLRAFMQHELCDGAVS